VVTSVIGHSCACIIECYGVFLYFVAGSVIYMSVLILHHAKPYEEIKQIAIYSNASKQSRHVYASLPVKCLFFGQLKI